MLFYKTNNVDDAGTDHSVEEVVAAFMESSEYASWKEYGGMLMRFLHSFVMGRFGGWDDDAEAVEFMELCVSGVIEAHRQAIRG